MILKINFRWKTDCGKEVYKEAWEMKKALSFGDGLVISFAAPLIILC